MSEEKKTIKFQMLMSETEAETIDDWGFKHRIRSRAEAIRQLCQIGMIFSDGSEEIIRTSIKSRTYIEKINQLHDDLGPVETRTPDDFKRFSYEANNIIVNMTIDMLKIFAMTTTYEANIMKRMNKMYADLGPEEDDNIVDRAKKVGEIVKSAVADAVEAGRRK